MAVYFVSGHGDLTQDEFNEHYVPLLNWALFRGDSSFVVGDYKGADTLAQTFLKKLDASVTVYHMFDKPRNNVGFPTKGGFVSDEQRDSAMTSVSDYDIAWIRPGKEKSGTEQNIQRRKNG